MTHKYDNLFLQGHSRYANPQTDQNAQRKKKLEVRTKAALFSAGLSDESHPWTD